MTFKIATQFSSNERYLSGRRFVMYKIFRYGLLFPSPQHVALQNELRNEIKDNHTSIIMSYGQNIDQKTNTRVSTFNICSEERLIPQCIAGLLEMG